MVVRFWQIIYLNFGQGVRGGQALAMYSTTDCNDETAREFSERNALLVPQRLQVDDENLQEISYLLNSYPEKLFFSQASASPRRLSIARTPCWLPFLCSCYVAWCRSFRVSSSILLIVRGWYRTHRLDIITTMGNPLKLR